MTKQEVDQVLEALDEQFMRPEVWRGDAWEVSANQGETHIVPTDVLGKCGLHVHNTGLTVADLADYVDGTIDTDNDGNPVAELRVGIWFARLSAPGYMDATDCAIFDTEEEAREYLAETYGDDIELDEEEETPEDEDIYADDPAGPFFYLRKQIAANRAELRAWMAREGYAPNVWWTSDHGNQHQITDINDPAKD